MSSEWADGSGFTIKDSGARAQFDSGMVRDTEDNKVDYSLIFDGPMLTRWAEHLTKGAKKYAPRNWMQARGQEEYDRFKRSLLRHLVAYLAGERDEDHAAAIIFNINGMEYVRDQQLPQVPHLSRDELIEQRRYVGQTGISGSGGRREPDILS